MKFKLIFQFYILNVFVTANISEFQNIKQKEIQLTIKKPTPIIGTRIVGGIEPIRNFPHQVGLKVSLKNFRIAWCGGSLISHKFILTAAHCCDEVASIELILGALDLQKREVTQRRIISTNFILHPNWDRAMVANDIALIQSPVIILFNRYIKPIKLPSRLITKESLYGKQAIVSGWGKYLDSSYKVGTRLRYMTVPIILNSMCVQSYEEYITDSNFCTSGLKTESTCNGDSGGPCTIINHKNEIILVGVISFGTITCETKEPSVYTWILPYFDWIQNVTKLII